MDEIRNYLDNWFIEHEVTRENAGQNRGNIIRELKGMNKYEMPVIGKTVGLYFNEKFPKEKKVKQVTQAQNMNGNAEDMSGEEGEPVIELTDKQKAFLMADEFGSVIMLTRAIMGLRSGAIEV